MNDPGTVRNEFIERCTACGLCAVMCPPFAHRRVPDTPQKVQMHVLGYLEGHPPANAVLERSRLCNECFKCVSDTCPQGLNPMRTNQLLRGLLHQEGVEPCPFIPPSDPASDERVVASLLTTDEEYRRITTPAVTGDGRILFFPGCNIYYQPNLLLTALDILDLISHDWTFLPGLDHCCGSNHDSAGRLEAGARSLENLTSAFDGQDFETIAVWCSTCAVRLRFKGFNGPVVSLARLITDHLHHRGAEGATPAAGVTLHEPCKDGYLDMDPEAPRELLGLVNGEPVREMAHHGRKTVCCGWALRKHRPDVWEENLKKRLDEAGDTGADTLATVCHGCQWIMDRTDSDSVVRVRNYISLAGESLGIRHRERFRELRELGSREAVLDAVSRGWGDRSNRLPFDKSRISRAVDIILGDFYGRGA